MCSDIFGGSAPDMPDITPAPTPSVAPAPPPPEPTAEAPEPTDEAKRKQTTDKTRRGTGALRIGLTLGGVEPNPKGTHGVSLPR